MAAAAISNYPAAETLASVRATPMAGNTPATGNTGAADTSSAGISANDFLTLLVTEMKNQDPTAQTDPNEYVNQLVNVNSLEQLIDINQTLTAAYGPGSISNATSAATSNVVSSSIAHPASVRTASAQSDAQMSLPAGGAINRPTLEGLNSAASAGNLSIPGANPAATRLAESLAGRTHLDSTISGSSFR